MREVIKNYKLIILSSLYIILIFSVYSYGQWNQITFPSNENLLMVRFVSETTGWVVGENFVYKTTDGGNNWETQDSVLGSWCEALCAIDSLTVVYADYPRGIRRTSDGGTTWNTIDSEDYYYFDLKFINNLLGFAACGSVSSIDSGIVRRTINGGETWTTIASVYFPYDGYDFEGVSFVDSLNGWAVSYTGCVYNTTDGGFSWSFQDSVGLSNYFQYVPCRDIQFTTSDSGWVVGGFTGENLVARTTDGGQTWFTEIRSGCSIREIDMINSQVGWFAGANYLMYIAKTTDGGNTWVDQLPQAGFESISMVNENVGYAVGDNGRVYKTTNGGVTFIEEETSESQPTEFLLSQNYPNPFNPATTIRFTIPLNVKSETSNASLKVYDALGNEVATIVNEEKPAGSYEIEFDARNLPSGIYYYTLNADEFTKTRKMILLK